MTKTETYAQSKLSKLDKTIDALMIKNRQHYIQPVSAFITFQDNQVFEESLKFMKSKKKMCGYWSVQTRFEIFDVNPLITRAPEPSNIIWENYTVSPWQRFKRKHLAYTVISVLYIILFFGLLKMMRYTTDFQKYFSIEICQTKEFPFMENGVVNLDKMRKRAVEDKNPSLQGEGLGIYACYCRNRYDVANLINSFDGLCTKYNKLHNFDSWYNYGISATISLTDLILRAINSQVIRRVGFRTIS